MSNHNQSIPKIHVITRPNLNKALIIVRKGQKQTGFFALDFSTNKVSEGQWFRGKVYERRCDLSNNGKHIIYFAAKFGNRDITTWTAVSKFPYLKALDFYVKNDTYNGGGIFLSDNMYLLNETYRQDERYKNSPYLVKRGKLNDVLLDNETDGLYYPRLIRDGWEDLGLEDEVRRFKKAYKKWSIIKSCYINKGPHKAANKAIFYDINELRNADLETCMTIESDYMDFKKGQLYWTCEGKILRANLNRLDEVKEIDDLNNYSYRPIVVKY